jgi:hypothetical protein
MSAPAATSPAPSPPTPASKAYDLYYLVDGKFFFLKNPNRGVTMVDAGRDSCLTWEAKTGPGRQLWTHIVSVTMMTGSDGKAEVNQCKIAFRDGRSLTVSDAGESGTVDHERTPIYSDFIRALHLRLAQAPAGTIAFKAGMTDGRYLGMKIAMVIAGLFFVGTPLVLLFIVHDWRVLGVLCAGAAFVWVPWKIVQKNKPRSYDPKSPPGELME